MAKSPAIKPAKPQKLPPLATGQGAGTQADAPSGIGFDDLLRRMLATPKHQRKVQSKAKP